MLHLCSTLCLEINKAHVCFLKFLSASLQQCKTHIETELVLVIVSGVTLREVCVRLSYQCRTALIESLLAAVAANSGLS